jgi:predicted MFS family arabinose efflux permease
MGRTQVSMGIMNLVGAPLGGLLFTIQRFLPFLFDAISYLISVGSLFLMRVSFQEQRMRAEHHLLSEIAEGLLWLWRQPLLRTMALITAGNVFFGAGQTLIVILIAQRHHASDAVIGLIFSIVGAGNIVGAMLADKVSRRFHFAQIILGALWLFALLWLSMALLPSPLLLGLIIAALFFVGPFYNVTYVSYRLALTPDVCQGRMNSVARLIGNGLAPLGIVLTGVLLQYADSRIAVLFSAGGQIVLALLAMMSVSIRKAHLQHPIVLGEELQEQVS